MSNLLLRSKISLQSAAVNWQSDSFRGTIYLAGDGTEGGN